MFTNMVFGSRIRILSSWQYEKYNPGKSDSYKLKMPILPGSVFQLYHLFSIISLGTSPGKTVGLGIALILYLTNYVEVCLPNSTRMQDNKLHVEVLLQWLLMEFLLINTLPVILHKSVAYKKLVEL